MKAKHIIGSIARTLLALTFLFSGFVKAVDPLGTVYKIEDYLRAFGSAEHLPALHGLCDWLMPMAGVAAVCLIALELLLGLCMLLNVRTQWTAWLSLVFYVVMTPLTLWIALTNPVSDCGCFGDAVVLSNWQTFWKNIVLLTLVIVLLVCRKAIPQLWSWWAELSIALIGLALAGGLMGYAYTHLPPMDFRPYKVGNHIPTLMEDEVPPVIEVYYRFEKDGAEQEFVYTERPDLQGDSSWTFVGQETRVLQAGKEATIHDFSITTMAYDDITYDVLESEEPVTLVTLYDLDKTNRKQAAKLLALYNTCAEQGRQCYFLTGSGEDLIYRFAEEIGMDALTAEQVFCYMDPVTLKTIVRANPGVLVVENGYVTEKHNVRQL